MRFLSGSRPGRWTVWVFYRAAGKPLPVPHAAEWMMIPEHSVDQVLETGALRSLYPQDVLEAARRMDRHTRIGRVLSLGSVGMQHEQVSA